MMMRSDFVDEVETKSPMMIPVHETLQNMYQRSPYEVTAIESYEMDCLLKSLNGPAHHALYTIHHAFQICQNFEEALLHCNHLVKDGYLLILKKPDAVEDSKVLKKRSFGVVGFSDKDQFHIDDSLLQPGLYFDARKQGKASDLPDGWILLNKKKSITTKKIIQRIVSTSKSNSSRTLQLLQELHQHLWICLGTDIRDGTADIALSLSMIPLTNIQETLWINEIMDILTHIAALEITRRTNQKSRRSVEILMIVEKLAAAGCDQSDYMKESIKAALLALPNSQNYDQISEDTLNGLKDSDMFSSRSLLWLWRKGHVFHKVTKGDLNIALTVDDLLSNPPQFDDPSLPLVVDVGCGLGVTLLGLASSNICTRKSKASFQLDLDWSRYNYLGSDLSLTAIQWATSQALRRDINGICHFLHASAEALLQYLTKVKANIKLLLLQFPTPYRLQLEGMLEVSEEMVGGEQTQAQNESSRCNDKLPLSPNDPSFMANPTALNQMVHLLIARDGNLLQYDDHHKNDERYLLLQSNCEDVALHLYDGLIDLGLLACDYVENPRMTFDGLDVSSRTKSWLAYQHKLHLKNVALKDVIVRRAIGAQWSNEPLIPIRTETEASSEFQKTPVHRCLFFSRHS